MLFTVLAGLFALIKKLPGNGALQCCEFDDC